MKKRILGFTTAALLVLALGGCAASDGASTGGDVVGSGQEIAAIDVSDLSGGVAVEVGDAKIGENAITAYLNNFRYSQGLQDDADWGQWIYDAGYSMDGLRADTIEYFVSQELIRQAATQEGVVVSDDEIDQAIADARNEASDAEYSDALDIQGVDEAAYRENVRVGLLQQKLKEKVVGASDVDDKTLLEYLKLYYPDEVPEDTTSLDGIDEERIKTVRDLVSGFTGDSAFTDWLSGFRDKVGVLTHMKPDGLPYVVDLAPYAEAAESAQNSEANSSTDSGAGENSENSTDEGAGE